MATTTTEILTLKPKQPSERLKQAINNCSLGFKKLADAIHEALELGKQEGFSPKEIGKMIRFELRNNNFSDSTIRRYLPAEAKMLSKVRQQVGEFAVNLTAKSDLAPKPQDYQTEDLPKYSKQFLIEIIRCLEQKYCIKQYNQQKSIRSKSSLHKINLGNDDDKTQEILALRNQGKSIRAIAAATGIPSTTVARRLKSNLI